MKILFICKHNRFRGKIAEACFKKINKNKKIKVASAGVFKGIPVAKTVINIGKELGIKINKKTIGLREEYLNEFDIIVIVADNVPISLFKGAKKIMKWNISDSSQNDKKSIEKIMKEIFKKVKELNKRLKTRKFARS